MLPHARVEDRGSLEAWRIGPTTINKPFSSPAKLLARIRAILRRSGSAEAPAAAATSHRAWSGVDTAAEGCALRVCNRFADIEFGSCKALMRRAGEVVDQGAAGGKPYWARTVNLIPCPIRSLDMHVRRLLSTSGRCRQLRLQVKGPSEASSLSSLYRITQNSQGDD